METSERSTDGETGETRFCDGGVDDPLLAEAVEQALGDLVAVEVVSTELRHTVTARRSEASRHALQPGLPPSHACFPN